MSDVDTEVGPSSPSSMPKVLLIDDEHDLLEILALELQEEGYAVTAVDNGAAAIEAARRQRFSAAITDLRMPGMDGIATMRALKQLDPDLPVIVATGFVYELASVAFGQQAAFGLILKPFGLDEFLGMVRRAVDERENNVQREAATGRSAGRPTAGASGIRAR